MTLPIEARLKDGRDATVRRARPADAEAWIANGNAVASEMIYLMTEKFTRPPDEVRNQFEVAPPTRELWLVADVRERIVGGANFVRGRNSKNDHVADLGMSILSEFRGLGLGTLILKEGVEWARSVGIFRLKLGVFATNERAIALYRKFGFVEEGRLLGEVILHGLPVDEVLMALRL